MPGMDKTGPEGKGSLTGRKLGRCKEGAQDEDQSRRLGKGMGARRRADGGKGQGLRLRSGQA